MFEMLGNQLFLIRNYSRAAEILEQALWKDPENKGVRRKLIICYSQIGQVEKAFDNFTWLINKDIEFIVHIDPVAEECPCSELVYDMESKLSQNQDSLDFNLILGMLWLYCDENKSLRYLTRANGLDPANSKIKSAISVIQTHLQQQKNTEDNFSEENNVIA